MNFHAFYEMIRNHNEKGVEKLLIKRFAHRDRKIVLNGSVDFDRKWRKQFGYKFRLSPVFFLFKTKMYFMRCHNVSLFMCFPKKNKKKERHIRNFINALFFVFEKKWNINLSLYVTKFYWRFFLLLFYARLNAQASE